MPLQSLETTYHSPQTNTLEPAGYDLCHRISSRPASRAMSGPGCAPCKGGAFQWVQARNAGERRAILEKAWSAMTNRKPVRDRLGALPPDERGGNRYVLPNATAPHLDSTDSRPGRASSRSGHVRYATKSGSKFGAFRLADIDRALLDLDAGEGLHRFLQRLERVGLLRERPAHADPEIHR